MLLEQLVPSTAKFSKQHGYDTVSPKIIAVCVRMYYRDNSAKLQPLRISKKKYTPTKSLTKWKIYHKRTHIGHFECIKQKHGVKLDWHTSGYVNKLNNKDKQDWYKAHCKSVAIGIKNYIDFRADIGEAWKTRQLPAKRSTRELWMDVYQEIRMYREIQLRDYRRKMKFKYMVRHLIGNLLCHVDNTSDQNKRYSDSTIKKIMRAGDKGKLRHVVQKDKIYWWQQ